MARLLRKIRYYRDIGLLFYIGKNILITMFTPRDKYLSLIDETRPQGKIYPHEKLIKYVNFVYFVMGKFMIRPSCFTNSVTVCRMYRQNDVDAHVVFGCLFEEERLRGHCWVELGRDTPKGRFHRVFSYPFAH